MLDIRPQHVDHLPAHGERFGLRSAAALHRSSLPFVHDRLVPTGRGKSDGSQSTQSVIKRLCEETRARERDP